MNTKIPKFNAYELVEAPSFNLNNKTEVPSFDKLQNNLINIVERRKRHYVKEPDVKEPSDKKSDVNDQHVVPDPILLWTDTYTGALHDQFKNDLDEALKSHPEYNTQEWKHYLTDLAHDESSFNPDSINAINAAGYFLIMPDYRKETWQNNVELFDDLFKLMNENISYFNRNLTEDDRKKMKEQGLDIYGLIGGAHLGGAYNALQALRGVSNKNDGNKTIKDYFERFKQTK